MKLSDNYRELDSKYYMQVFTRELRLVRGKGARVWDDAGNEYIDCVAGIAVCSTGHCHPAVVRAICEQAGELIHCSNLFYVPHQAELAERLCRITGYSRVFLTNSGAEATDAAIKLVRVTTKKRGFIAFTHGFHGRTMGSLALTHKPAIREPFGPFEPKCSFVEYGDLDGVERAVGPDTAAIIVEPIQGEAGVILPPEGFLRGIREICDAKDLLMIADEIQTGMGRTGTWLAVEHERVRPDIVLLAKGIASGFPMGAMLAREGLEFRRGEHGSTFAGGPLACAAARATIDVIENVLPTVREKGRRFMDALRRHAPRGRGLMIGITAGERCTEIQRQCMARGVLINCAADGNLRLVPPLIISGEEIELAARVIDEAIG